MKYFPEILRKGAGGGVEDVLVGDLDVVTAFVVRSKENRVFHPRIDLV